VYYVPSIQTQLNSVRVFENITAVPNTLLSQAAYSAGVSIQYWVITILCTILRVAQLRMFKNLQRGTKGITVYVRGIQLVARDSDVSHNR
jgi:hypothetical protein